MRLALHAKRKTIIGITFVVVVAGVAGVAVGIGIERVAYLDYQREVLGKPSFKSSEYVSYSVCENLNPTPSSPAIVRSKDDLLAYYDPDGDPTWVKHDDGAYYQGIETWAENNPPNRYVEFTKRYDDVFFEHYCLIEIDSSWSGGSQPPWLIVDVRSDGTNIRIIRQSIYDSTKVYPAQYIEWTTFIEVPRAACPEGIDTVELVWE